jgi:hypothetical protein
MLLEQLGLVDVTGENVSALVPDISFIFHTLAPPTPAQPPCRRLIVFCDAAPLLICRFCLRCSTSIPRRSVPP